MVWPYFCKKSDMEVGVLGMGYQIVSIKYWM